MCDHLWGEDLLLVKESMLFKLSCQTEVTHFQIASFDENVSWLQVSVDEPVLVNVFDSTH